MPTGTITSQISTSNMVIPLLDAYVWISQGDELISFQVTDENGKTEPTELETPNKEESLSPESGAPAFAVCDIHIYHPLYQPAVIRNVQVFAGINSLQELSLIPLPEYSQAGDNLAVTNVTRQNL